MKVAGLQAGWRDFWCGCRILSLIIAMIVIADEDATSDERMIADHHLLNRTYMNGVIDLDVAANVQYWPTATWSERVQPHIYPSRKPVTELH